MKRFLAAIFKGFWIYSLLVWLYIIIEVHLYPEIIRFQYLLAVLVPIREDFMAVIAFAISGVSFILWSWIRNG